MPPARPAAEPYLQERLAKLRAAMAGQKLAALLVTSFKDVSYLTGFEGDDSYALVTPDDLILISDFRYTEQISRECPWVTAVLRKKGIMLEVTRRVKKNAPKTLGVQADHMTLHQRQALDAELKNAGVKTQVKPVDEIVMTLRHMKDAHEIAIMESAINIAEHGFEMLRAELKVGMTENEVASLLVYEMRKRGAAKDSFDTIVAAGANGSLPHYRPANVKIQSNSALLVDWGAFAHGYCSDLTRMIFVGTPPAQIKEIYRIVLDAQLAAIDAIKPGKSGKAVDKIARDLITRAGYGEKFGHGLGHGLGRDIHEEVRLSRLSTTTLQPGMIVTVEPGIYLPGLGGVRIEDDVLVTETGHRVLSRFPKSLESARL